MIDVAQLISSSFLAWLAVPLLVGLMVLTILELIDWLVRRL